MHNNESHIFTQGIPHFLTIELVFEEVLLNLNKAERYSRDRPYYHHQCDASFQTVHGGGNHLTNKLRGDYQEDIKSKLERTEGKKVVPRKEEKREQQRNSGRKSTISLAQHPNHHPHHQHIKSGRWIGIWLFSSRSDVWWGEGGDKLCNTFLTLLLMLDNTDLTQSCTRTSSLLRNWTVMPTAGYQCEI